MHLSYLSVLGSLISSTAAQSTFTPARPPSIPLAVKSPYLNTWFPAGSEGGNGGYLPGQWPTFYTGQITGWTGLVRVDGKTFTWMGLPKDIEAAYPEWVSGDLNAVAQWDFGTAGDISYHKIWKQNQQLFNEVGDRAEWGNFYYATDSQLYHLSHQSGSDLDVRRQFTREGKLTNSADTNYRAIRSDWPVFGYAVELGSVGASPTSTVFSMGLCQDEAMQFLGKDGLTNLHSLWKSYFPDDVAALSFFHKDFPESNKLSSDLDAKIFGDSTNKAGDDYAILTSLAARQAFAGTQLVGTEQKPFLFLKEISSNGNTQTIDVIFPASPIFYYTNPELVRMMLDPHFDNQESGHYPHKWAIHDLGAHYPNATGHEDGGDEHMPIEECGNLLIMVLAYVQRSGNNDYIKQHYAILKQWADFLVTDSLYPAYQLSTDDFAGHMVNQTNLALKGMIGLEAMSKISTIAGQDADAKYFTDKAHDYITQWQDLAINKGDNPPHTILNYGNWSSHGLLYNLYSDKLLNTNLVPQSVYDMQSAFYPTVNQKYGVPLDTRHPYQTKGDWEIFCAAVASEQTRDMFIADLAKWVNETPTSRPFIDLYDTNSGKHVDAVFGDVHMVFLARPVMGGMFAALIV